MKFNFKNIKELLESIKTLDIKMVDLRFTDIPGTLQHFTVPIRYLKDELFSQGIGFDGSSIRGFQEIHKSDMIALPDISTCYLDPFASEKTLVFHCNIKDPITKNNYINDPRYIARKAAEYLKSSGVGDEIFFGPEAEFFIFNNVKYDSGTNFSFYEIDSKEGTWNTGSDENPNLGHKLKIKGGYSPLPPNDSLNDIRTEMVLTLEEIGVNVEAHHHEVATGGQSEICLEFSPLLLMADNIMKYKYVVKNISKQHGMTATFMPKPIYGDNGSGMHVHQSIWKSGKTLMYDESNYANLSDTALYYIGGILKHTPALLGFCAPSTNSYKRLVPGYEAPVNIAYSQRNRSAAVRIPISDSPNSKRIEFRCPDPSSNPYLAFSSMLMAGIDGINNKIHPGNAVDKNIYALSKEESKDIQSTPGSLAESLDALENDHDFLLQGNVFPKELIDQYIEYKRKNEVNPINLRTHPYELYLYYDV